MVRRRLKRIFAACLGRVCAVSCAEALYIRGQVRCSKVVNRAPRMAPAIAATISGGAKSKALIEQELGPIAKFLPQPASLGA